MSGPGVSNAVVEGCSGALGSVVALLATYPLKTIYTLQALTTDASTGAAAKVDSGSKLAATLRFLQTYKLASLYDGLGPNVVEAALSSGVYFFFYCKLREQAVAWSRSDSGADSRGKDIGVLASLLVPLVAGALNQLTTMPASVVATRMQGYRSLPGAKNRKPPTTWETIASVFAEDGLGGFWKGMLPSMILLANPAVQYMLFEKLKGLMRLWKAQRLAAAAKVAASSGSAEALDRRRSADSDEAIEGDRAECKGASRTAASAPVVLSAGEVFLAGALAKIGATVVTYPLIVVKARMQASAGKAVPGSAYRTSTWGIIADTARNEGLGGFFKGLRAKILQTALNAALMLMVKEQLHGATKNALMLMSSPAKSAPAPAAAG